MATDNAAQSSYRGLLALHHFSLTEVVLWCEMRLTLHTRPTCCSLISPALLRGGGVRLMCTAESPRAPPALVSSTCELLLCLSAPCSPQCGGRLDINASLQSVKTWTTVMFFFRGFTFRIQKQFPPNSVVFPSQWNSESLHFTQGLRSNQMKLDEKLKQLERIGICRKIMNYL